MTEIKRIVYEEIKAQATGWIHSADSKAAGLLAIGGAVLGAAAFIPLSDASSRLTRLDQLVLGFSAICSLASVAASSLVLAPRLNRDSALGVPGPGKRLRHSTTYFGELARLKFDEFTSTLDSVPEEVDAHDLKEQAYVLTRTARAKMVWVRRSVAFLLGSFLAVAALVVLTLVGL